MGTRGSAARRVALVAGACFGMAAAPAPAAIVLNEVESDGASDFIELVNTGPGAVDISGFELKDSNDGNVDTIPGGTVLAPGAFYAHDTSFGLSSSDAARVFDRGGVLLDRHVWTSHAARTYGRCPDGTGAFTGTIRETRGAANACAGPATPWPGGPDVVAADVLGQFGDNMSGLAYQPSGTSTPGVLWAVRNNPGTLFRLVRSGDRWVPDPANGWAGGKLLRYPGGLGNPDAEGVTLGADANAIYVSTERDGNGPSRPAVLRFDVSGPGAELVATHDFDMTRDLPGLAGNGGLEAVAFVPDDVLVAKGFRDESRAGPYDPAAYPAHGGGLFFVGVEQDARIVAYAADVATGAVSRVATIASGLASVMDLHFETETKLLWAACDNNCDGRTRTFDVDGAGAFAPTATYDRPAGMDNLNNEGFTLAPQAECAGGRKPAFWLDDTNASGNALRAGSVRCTVPAPIVPVNNGGGAGAGGGAVAGAGSAGTPAAPVVTTTTRRDTTRPVVTVLRATRRAVGFRLSERARVRVVVERRVGRRYRSIRSFTVLGVAAGRRTISLKGRVPRRGVLRIALVATDAAGNRSLVARRRVTR